MQAWRSRINSGADGLTLASMSIPEPSEGELLVKVRTAALNFSDLLMLAGKYQVQPPLPYTPGQEVAGIVIEAGANTSFKPSQRVASKMLCGGFAEYALVRADMAIPIPETMPFAEAAALPVVYTTAMVALTESTQVKDGDHVLIQAAAGGVGLASVQIAKALGAYVIGTAGSDEKCKVVLEQGADMALNYKNDDWVNIVRQLHDHHRADIIVDSVGGEVTINSLHCLARKGRLLIIGFASGTIPKIPAHLLLLKRAQAIGVYWNHDYDGEMIARATTRVIDLYNQQKIRPLVHSYDGLESLPQALTHLAERRSVGKLALTLTEE